MFIMMLSPEVSLGPSLLLSQHLGLGTYPIRDKDMIKKRINPASKSDKQVSAKHRLAQDTNLDCLRLDLHAHILK